jgi:hypothetical protein
MSNLFTARIAARFAPLDFANVYGFPNTVPDIKIWGDILPKFGEDEDENPGQHLFEFHKLMEELNVHHEDVLMKLFMFSLEKDARLWYKSLPHSSIPSLKCFHTLFHQHCKRIYSTEILFEDCCDTSPLEEEEEKIEISQVDEDEQYEEELAHRDAGSCELTQEEEIRHHGQLAKEIERNDCCFIQEIHRPPSPLTKEEKGLPLHSYVAAPTHTDLQLSNSPGYECQISSISKNVNLFLNGDSHLFYGTLQQVSEPVYDDFLLENQILDSALFHEKDMVAMFNDPEHHESEHRVVIDVLKPQYDMFFQDPFAVLLDSFNGGIFYVMNVCSQELMKGLQIHDHQQVSWELSVSFFILLEESVRKFQISRQLLDWLHQHFRII